MAMRKKQKRGPARKVKRTVKRASSRSTLDEILSQLDLIRGVMENLVEYLDEREAHKVGELPEAGTEIIEPPSDSPDVPPSPGNTG